MSDHYFPHCLDCEDTCNTFDGWTFRHDWGPILGMRHEIAALAKASKAANHGGMLLQTVLEGRIDIHWFAEHHEHRLRIISEYGTIEGTCSKRVACDCGHGAYCRREPDHDGACDAKAVVA